jgi:hypothetical protein
LPVRKYPQRKACEDHIERAGRLAVEEYSRRVPTMAD